MLALTTRRRNIISGLAALVILAGATTVGVKFSFGAFDSGYRLHASFAAAGQGLVDGSDVKIRGVNIGHVDSIRLEDGRAEVTLFINSGYDIPADAQAVIRPKTLFGEKFVDIDPGPAETTGPYLGDGDRIEDTLGGFELEQVLADTYPILQAVDPAEVMTILDTLAQSADGMGPAINRSIVNGQRVLDVQARHDADTRQFLEDLADLSGELADRSGDLVTGAQDLNQALPVLNQRGDQFEAALQQLARVSDQVSDILDANQAFITANYGPGQDVLDLLSSRRSQIVPLVIGLRQYTQTLAEVARIPVGDGTLMAAVKGLIGAQACAILGCPVGALPVDGASAPPTTTGPLPPITIPDPLGLGLNQLNGEVSTGGDAIVDIMTGLLGDQPR